jgi:hypothetical protein
VPCRVTPEPRLSRRSLVQLRAGQCFERTGECSSEYDTSWRETMTDLNEHVKKMSGTSNERRVKRVNRQNIEKSDDESGVAKGKEKDGEHAPHISRSSLICSHHQITSGLESLRIIHAPGSAEQSSPTRISRWKGPPHLRVLVSKYGGPEPKVVPLCCCCFDWRIA